MPPEDWPLHLIHIYLMEMKMGMMRMIILLPDWIMAA